jgi:2-polyprenyl-6-methoxyphenol hydroxylase-like FAD-dependent oxidoreductase
VKVTAAEAVVVGGGHAGLLAVPALLGRSGQITVIERDRYPEGPAFRAGVPQARHLHILLAGGQQALERLLPGTVAALRIAGARQLVPPQDVLIHTPGGWHDRFGFTCFPTVSCTRPLFDFVVRTRVLAAAAASGTAVEVIEGAEVTGLLGTPERVAGVKMRYRGAGQPEREMPADLVVDASGRGSRAPGWLEALGLPAPAEEVIDARLAYATRMFRLADEPDAGVLLQPEPRRRRGGVLMPVEGGRWLLTLSGFTGTRPPTDEDAFLDYAATLAHPYLHRVMKAAEPVSPVHGFLDTSNRHRRYERRGAAPDGFVVIGDAASSFNPVYGQGLTAAALHAVALRDAAAARGLGRGFSVAAQRAVARASATPWRTATAVDRGYLAQAAAEAGTSPRVPVPERLSRWFNDRLIEHAARNQRVAEALHGVYALALPPARLLSPAVALPVLLRSPAPGHAEPPERLPAQGRPARAEAPDQAEA